MMERKRRIRHHRERAQGLVEFALVLPIALVVIFGIISACWLFFQSTSVTDGSRVGAREAAIEQGLDQGASGCESNKPVAIQVAVQKAMSVIPVDQNQLCQNPTNLSQLIQQPVAGDAQITVTANPGLNNPTSVTVTVSYTTTAIGDPTNHIFNLTASSTQPIFVP